MKTAVTLPETVADLHPAEYNPRTIDPEVLHDLKRSQNEYGDLGGIVFNVRTGNLVGGHQRAKNLPKDAPVIIRDRWPTPNQQGTIGIGSITWHGEEWAVRLVDVDEVRERAMNIAANTERGRWDPVALAPLVDQLNAEGYDLDVLGLRPGYLDSILAEVDRLNTPSTNGAPHEDEGPVQVEQEGPPKSQPGEVYELGRHRLLCGDSTDPEAIARLLAGEKAVLVHADPPYGMGKEADGVANDNLYREKLDAFQMRWWRAVRPHLVDNASAYIWGQPEDLWRLWYLGGLRDSERLSFRNEIVWNKGSGIGMASGGHRQYPTGSERCLFFMFGDQFFGNVNAADYWEGWEPIRSYLAGEAERMEWGPRDIQRICGVGMFGHWFTKSQWCMIPEPHYLKLREASGGTAFLREYGSEEAGVRGAYDRARLTGEHRAVMDEFRAQRAYFDNTHEAMIEVWPFPRVLGEERWGHATPKPLAMIERIVRSSSPDGGLVIEPFLGTGTTLCAAETTGRRCFGAELDARYCDAIRTRYARLVKDDAYLP